MTRTRLHFPRSTALRSTAPPVSAAILAVKAAYVQGLVLFFTSLAFLWWFDRCVLHWCGVQQPCTFCNSLASKRGRAGRVF